MGSPIITAAHFCFNKTQIPFVKTCANMSSEKDEKSQQNHVAVFLQNRNGIWEKQAQKTS